MKRVHRVLLVASALLGALAVALVWMTSSVSVDAPAARPELSSVDVEPLTTCAPTQEQAFTGQAQERMTRLLTFLVREQGVDQANETLSAALTEAPQLNYACHAPAHAAGSSTYRGQGSAEVAIRVLRDGVCESGILHGVLDATVPEMTGDMFVFLARACEDTADEEEIGRCADGLGHVAGARQTPQWCASFASRTGKENCGGGYIMGMYQPVGADEPLPGVAWSDVAQACHGWPADAAPTGCAVGAAYAFTRIFVTQGVMLQVRPASPRTQKSLVRKVVHAQKDGCALLPTDLVVRCQQAVLEYIPDPMREHPVMEQVCQRTPSSVVDICMDLRRAAISSRDRE